ncbi:MAG: aspartate aminotransferase family protein, partial [bacterium]|nr:aspartate aminotransferase family protein [bacterium]
DYEQVGTFNGNPLTMATAKAVLTEIMDDDAYRHLDSLRERMASGVEGVIAEYGLAAHVITVGAKGCVTFSSTPTRNYRDYMGIEDAFSHLHWLFQHNGGVFLPPWGKSEQWTLSVQHTAEDVQRFVDNFRAFARALAQ